jgi:transposase
MAKIQTDVIGGVDTHKHTHYAAVIDRHGQLLGDREFEACADGYRQLLAWMRSHGSIQAIGVEGTGHYGTTLTRFLTGSGERVVEVNRPNRQARRLEGKSDRLDAEQAARSVLSGAASADPKAKSGAIEVIRILRVTRASAVKSRTMAFNLLHGVVVTAPSPLREELVHLTKRTLVNRCYRLRPETDDLVSLLESPERLLLAGTKKSLRELAHRFKELDEEVKTLSSQITALVEQVAPELVAVFGVGAEIAGQFLVTAGDNSGRIRNEAALAKICGVAPKPTGSGKTSGRHRLNRSGDRAANSALYMITLVRLRHHEPTRRYLERRTAEGLSKREIIRCLKRYIVREIYLALPKVEDSKEISNAA